VIQIVMLGVLKSEEARKRVLANCVFTSGNRVNG
jgi:hypothetical protein